jgi:dipeptidyl aminopeptidase/acylaminoacyl peptidase
MYKIFLLFILFGLLAAGCNKPAPPDAPMATNSTSTQTAETEKQPHAVSLPALMQKHYDGRDLKLGKVQAETSTYTRYFITYKSGDLTISGIMNVPKGSGPFPVVIMNHGYIDPAVYTNGRGLRREQDYFASRGYIVIHPDYRNHAQSDKDPESEVNMRLGYVEDVINAIYALKAANLAYADTNRIAMLGHSMGGGVAQAVMVVQPDLVRAFMLYAPVSTNMPDNFNRWIVTRPEVASKITQAYGSPDQSPEFWKNLSPINFLDRVKAPVMISHGTADETVPLEWSQRTYDGLKKANKDAVFYTYPGEGHEFATAWPTVMQRTIDFLNEKLK